MTRVRPVPPVRLRLTPTCRLRPGLALRELLVLVPTFRARRAPTLWVRLTPTLRTPGPLHGRVIDSRGGVLPVIHSPSAREGGPCTWSGWAGPG